MTSKKDDPDPIPEESPLNFQPSAYGDCMDRQFRVAQGQGLTNAKSAEEFFGFHYNNVAGVHYHKQGWGSGLFFRLHDGRVYDAQARPHDPDPSWYDKTTH
jgi:hypothetical protein